MAVYLIAHDLGTTGNKATLFTDRGELINSAVYSYPTSYFNGNWAQQDPRVGGRRYVRQAGSCWKVWTKAR